MKFHGKIIAGRGVGRSLSFPTFNFIVPKNFELEEGVYAARIFWDEQKFPAVLFFGKRETFDDEQSLEIHVLKKFDESPNELDFEILEKIREVTKFDSPEKLRAQIEHDCEAAKKILRVV